MDSLPHNCLLKGICVPQLSDVSIKKNIWVSTTPLWNPEESRLMQDSQDLQDRREDLPK